MYILQKAALFADDDNPNSAHFLDLSSVKLPMLQEGSTDHKPGGGVMGIKISMGQIEALSLTFKMKGMAPDLLAQFGINSPRRRKYTIRGNILDVQAAIDIPAVAVIEGRILKADLSEFSSDNGSDSDFEVHEITYYNLSINGREKYHLDFWSGPAGFRVDGITPLNDVARNLGLL